MGYYADPLGFSPLELYSFDHRFDDVGRRFRTLRCAESPETCPREVLADFRPNLDAVRRHLECYGSEAVEDFPAAPVAARWRAQHVLIPVVVRLDGPLVDLTDVPTRQAIGERHVELLVAHRLDHLAQARVPRRRPIKPRKFRPAELAEREARSARARPRRRTARKRATVFHPSAEQVEAIQTQLDCALGARHHTAALGDPRGAVTARARQVSFNQRCDPCRARCIFDTPGGVSPHPRPRYSVLP